MKVEVIFLAILYCGADAILNHNPVTPGCPATVSPKENLVPDWTIGNWFEIQRFVELKVQNKL